MNKVQLLNGYMGCWLSNNSRHIDLANMHVNRSVGKTTQEEICNEKPKFKKSGTREKLGFKHFYRHTI